MDIAWHRDKAGIIHHGESIVLITLLHAKGASRDSEDMTEVLRIMKDKNVDIPHNKRMD